MSATVKKPPPDHPGNIRGRMSELRSRAKDKARSSGAADIETAADKLCEKEMKKLRARLKKVAHLDIPVTKETRKPRKTAPPAPKKETKKATKKARKAKPKPESREDIEDIEDIFQLLDMEMGEDDG
jgi:hypothetical protein